MRIFLKTALTLTMIMFITQISLSGEKLPGKGDKFIDFELKGLDGKTYDTAKLRADKFAIVEFGQTTCPFCHVQHEILKALYKEWEKYPLIVLDVYGGESADTVKEYVEKNKIPFSALLDEDARMMQRYDVMAFPTIYIVDIKGKVLFTAEGVTEKKDFEKILKPLLEKEMQRRAKEEKK